MQLTQHTTICKPPRYQCLDLRLQQAFAKLHAQKFTRYTFTIASLDAVFIPAILVADGKILKVRSNCYLCN